MDKTKLKELKELARKDDVFYCTGEWRYKKTVADEDGLADQLCYFEPDSDGGFYVPIEDLALVDGNLAEYIAAANPAVVLELIAEIERLEDENQSYAHMLKFAADSSEMFRTWMQEWQDEMIANAKLHGAIKSLLAFIDKLSGNSKSRFDNEDYVPIPDDIDVAITQIAALFKPYVGRKTDDQIPEKETL